MIARDPELAAGWPRRRTGPRIVRGGRTVPGSRRPVTGLGAAGRRARAQLVVTVMRMRFARQRGDLPAVAEHAERLLTRRSRRAAAPPTPPRPPTRPRLGSGEDLRAAGADRPGHRRGLDRPVRRGGAASRAGRHPGPPDRAALPGGHRPGALGAAGQLAVLPAGGAARHAGHRAGRRHGWTDEPVAGLAYVALGMALVAQGQLEEGGAVRSEQAERTLRAETEPAAGMRLRYARGLLELVSGRPEAALTAFRAAERLAGLLVTEHAPRPAAASRTCCRRSSGWATRERVEKALAELGGAGARQRARCAMPRRSLRLAQGDPARGGGRARPGPGRLCSPAATPISGSVQAFLLEAIARDALGAAGAARRALERALDLAQPEGLLFPFLLDPAPGPARAPPPAGHGARRSDRRDPGRCWLARNPPRGNRG